MPGNLAKLSPPRINNIYQRKRLYKRLDSACKHPVIWITSPAGAGKTTLISSYLQKKKLEPLWYQIDEGDADIASFFSYLGRAANRLMLEPKNLPFFTPEYLAGIATFSRNYFRELFSEIKLPGVIVFDNYHDVSLESKLHQVLQVGFEEIPDDINIIIISRESPPPEYSRLQASADISHIKWDEIQLETEETEAICKLRLGTKVIESPDFYDLHKQSQGWLAGLILMLENAGTLGIKSAINDYESQQKIFDYFAGEIMFMAKPDTQKLLLTTALLPKISANDAIALSNLPDADSILIDMTRRNYFTVRHSGSVPTYEYHPLFRKFLIEQGPTFFTASELLNLRQQAASLLEAGGYINDAICLLLASEQWQESIRCILKHAKEIALEGRGKTLLAWIEKLPDDLIKTIPWITYWKGMCHISFNPKLSRDYLEKAFYIFKNEEDIKGQLVSFCSIVDTYIYERTEMQTLDKWLDEVKSLIATMHDFKSSELEMRVTCAMFMALIYRQPDHPDVPIWEKRASEIVLSNADSGLRISIGNHLVLYYMWWVQDKAKVEIIVHALQPIIESGKAPPLARITWQMIEAGYHWMITGSGKSVQSAQKGLDIGEETGVHILDVYILTHAVFSSLCQRDNEAVEYYLNKMTPLIELHRYMDTSWYYYLYARGEIAKEDYESAYRYAELAVEHSLKSGRPYIVAHAYVVYGTVLYRKGFKDKAMGYIEKALELAEGMNFPVIIHLAEFARMEIEISEHGDNADLEQVKKCLELGKKAGVLSVFWFSTTSLASFFSLALKYNLDRDYVQECIQKSSLLPPNNNSAPSDWPYRIKIYTLGSFKILIDGELLSFTGKAQKKVLDLLKALIAYGGHEVNVETLCEALWSDVDGDTAYQSFTMTLQRLRKLIHHKEALVLSEGKLSLNSNYAWVDIWTFENGLVDSDEQVQERALKLYQGAFLENEPEAAWSLPLRDRLKRKFLRKIITLGQFHEKQNDYLSASKYYELGLELDPFAEDYYLLLMLCYIQQGQAAKAISLYRNCRSLLQQQLGVEPGKELKKLHSSLSEY